MINKRLTISVVVPVYNEIGNLPEFHKSLVAALKSTSKPFEIIYVDDNSTDGSYEWLKNRKKSATKHRFTTRTAHAISDSNALYVLKKQGKKGKAYSLHEGFSVAKGDIFVMIDSDLQYPPKAIPYMIADIMAKEADIIVAKRKNYKTNSVRRLISSGFKKVFGKGLFGLSTDIQSGLKVFSRQVYKTVQFQPTSPWAFDLEFLHRAVQAGYTIKNINITFAERLSGVSKIKFGKQVQELGLEALKLRFKKKKNFILPTDAIQTMHGAGIGYNNRKYITHTTLPFKLSAAETFSVGQKSVLALFVVLILGGLFVKPLLTLQLLVGALSCLYFFDTVFNFFITIRGLKKREEIRISQKELVQVDDKKLPVYSILCPLYKEAHVVPQFITAINNLDWPKEKLDVMLLLEEDDNETIKAIQAMDLPSYMRILVVPDSQPKTKPKACNYGLAFARGEYLVIYDAEDIPEPLQLKKAYSAFSKVSDKVKCLQAKLNFYNTRQNWLTRFFTAEYSLWFDLTLTGLQSFRSTLPLGGTSNHFRTADLRNLLGWDPFNVTEDADLGIRLFQKGYRTEVIDSTTLEEATSTTKAWIRQRSRWIKGYMQTYLVHMRHMSYFIKEKGLFHFLIFQLTVGGKILFGLINPLMWVTTIIYFALYVYASPFIEAVFAPPISYIAVFSFIFGNFLFLYCYMIGLGKRNEWDLMKYVFLIPYYWMLMSIAANYAFFQLLFKPHYWEKTTHGLHLPKTKTTVAVEEVVSKPAQKKNFILPTFAVKQRFFKPSFSSSLFVTLLIQIPIAAYFNTNFPDFLKIMEFLTITDVVIMSVLFIKKYHIKSFINNIASLFDIFTFSTKQQAWQEKKLRILIFNWRDTKHNLAGGAEVYVHELAKEWVKMGNQVTLFCGNDNQNLANETIDGISVIRRGGTYTVYLFAALYYLFSLRKNHDIIIDCENGIPFFTPLYSRKPIILLVHHVHQEVFRIFLQFPLKQIAKLLEGKVMPLVYVRKQVVTVSESSRNDIEKLGFIKPEHIHVVYNGVTPVQLQDKQKTHYPSFAYMGRLKDYKNIDIAIRAFASVIKDYPWAKFFIAGYGESYAKLSHLVQKLGLEENILFLGKITEEEKAVLLNQSWVVVQPSQMEGWGISVIEANAHGTPVIASQVSGLQDSVVHQQTGLLVPCRNVSEWSTAMRTLIQDHEYRQQLGTQAHTWSQKFRWDLSAKQFYALIGRSITKKLSTPLENFSLSVK